ncbi:MAG: rhodanese-like domain-containing protein, partial [Sedimenticola sp.]|nr:rhodanese-like domain-containing protein [Sedimenticola sp.]
MSAEEPIPLNPKQAYQMLEDDPRAILVDIRSSMEFLFVG